MKESGMISLLKKFENLRVLIIGDVMVDSYLWGNVSRVSPEAPVPVVMRMYTENRLGGAANVALNVKSLGATPVMCSVIGKDDNGRAFKEMIRKLGMPEDGLIESPERITTCKTRIIAGHQQLLRVDQEVEHYIEKELEHELWQRIQTLVDRNDISAIVFQDYDKGVITPGLIDQVIELGNQRHIPTLVDPKKRNFNYYRNATLFKPNFKELTEGLRLEIRKTDYDSVQEAALMLQKESGFSMVMITLSEQGMLLSMGKDFQVVPTRAREVADVSGAGDTVIATASLCLAAGMDAYEMAKMSNLAAGLVCEKVGVVPVEKKWLIDAASQD
ncbi:MAG: D-glycero-beta-D-manno-heptose-7-phosphate kinase [Bacteroidales bacterium]|nr:D-glycero-beta-D-manno-heptose-7-phosphate kinase [Bacteroidales bacterium]